MELEKAICDAVGTEHCVPTVHDIVCRLIRCSTNDAVTSHDGGSRPWFRLSTVWGPTIQYIKRTGRGIFVRGHMSPGSQYHFRLCPSIKYIHHARSVTDGNNTNIEPFLFWYWIHTIQVKLAGVHH